MTREQVKAVNNEVNMSINRSDITEEVYLIWRCPRCEEMNEVFDDCALTESALCDNCNSDFEIIDD